MTIQQIIDEQMKEFDKEFYLFDEARNYVVTFSDGKGFKGGTNASNLGKKLKQFLSDYTRKLIEAVGEEIIGEDEEVVEQEVEVGSNGCTVYDVTEDISIFRNYLRDDQRLKLKEIINSLK